MIQNILAVALINLLLPLVTLFPQDALSIGIIEQPTSFLPHEVQNDSERLVSDLLFRKLFYYEDGELKQDLVDSWLTNDNNTEYTIKLKSDINWQDGKPITSDDIIYTLTQRERIRDEISIEKLSDKEVKITLPRPLSILPSLLTFGLEPAHIKDQVALSPIGSTSFYVAKRIMEREKTQGVILQSFQKNKQYNRIVVMFYDKESDLKTAYELGEVNSFLSDTSYDVEGATEHSLQYLGRYFSLIFNTKSPKLQDAELRTKLMQAIDINHLLSKNYYFNSVRAEGPIGHSPYTKDVFLEETYDPEITLPTDELNKLESLDLILPNNQDGRQIEAFLTESWEKQLGLKLNIQYLDLDELIEAGKNGSFDIIFVGHEVSPDPDRYTLWHSTQIGSGVNFSGFEDLRADKALEEGRKEFKPENRTTHYNIFQDVMFTKVPAVFLYHPGQYFFISNKKTISMPKVLYYPSDIIQNL